MSSGVWTAPPLGMQGFPPVYLPPAQGPLAVPSTLRAHVSTSTRLAQPQPVLILHRSHRASLATTLLVSSPAGPHILLWSESFVEVCTPPSHDPEDDFKTDQVDAYYLSIIKASPFVVKSALVRNKNCIVTLSMGKSQLVQARGQQTMT